MRRPRSLILLPWTNVSPFTLVSASENVKKHRSLPDLKRGDFADPGTEGLAGSDHVREPSANVEDFGNENHDASLTLSAETQFDTPAEERTTPTLVLIMFVLASLTVTNTFIGLARNFR